MSAVFTYRRKGFTLIEVMVVITIVGLLASVVMAAMTNARAKARDTQRVQMVKELQKALELYRNGNGGNYPCATAPMPACASGGGGVYVNGTAVPATTAIFSAAISPYLTVPLEASTFSSNPTWGSIQYRVGGTTAAPILSSYTILLRREQPSTNTQGSSTPAGTFCDIRVGSNPNTGWPDANYPNCF
jgi:prepilin-type N-terminal cleavage/methylation domain-containing protein